MDVARPYAFIGFGAVDVTTSYEFIGFGTVDVTTSYAFIVLGAVDVTKSGPERRPEHIVWVRFQADVLLNWAPKPLYLEGARPAVPRLHQKSALQTIFIGPSRGRPDSRQMPRQGFV